MYQVFTAFPLDIRRQVAELFEEQLTSRTATIEEEGFEFSGCPLALCLVLSGQARPLLVGAFPSASTVTRYVSRHWTAGQCPASTITISASRFYHKWDRGEIGRATIRHALGVPDGK